MAVGGTLGVILLSRVAYITSYPQVYQTTVLGAGLSAMNVSILNDPDRTALATSEFWWYFPSLLTNSAQMISTIPVSCSNCSAYFLPGAMSLVAFDPTLPSIGKSNYSQAAAFIVHDAPGFQMEFSNVAENITFETEECKLYGVPSVAIQICIKQRRNSFYGGCSARLAVLTLALNACPGDVAAQQLCMSSLRWRTNTLVNEVAILKRRATTVFDRYNYTIREVLEFGTERDTINYGPNEFFRIYDAVFFFDPLQPNWNTSVQFQFLITCAGYFTAKIKDWNRAGIEDGLWRLRGLFTVPIIHFNNMAIGGPTYPNDLGTSVSLADIRYRVGLPTF